MKRMTMLAAATAAAMAVAPAATAQAAEGQQLRAAVEGGLRARGLPAEGVAAMPAGRLAVVKSLLDSEESHAGSTHRIKAILKAR